MGEAAELYHLTRWKNSSKFCREAKDHLLYWENVKPSGALSKTENHTEIKVILHSGMRMRGWEMFRFLWQMEVQKPWMSAPRAALGTGPAKLTHSQRADEKGKFAHCYFCVYSECFFPHYQNPLFLFLPHQYLQMWIKQEYLFTKRLYGQQL